MPKCQLSWSLWLQDVSSTAGSVHVTGKAYICLCLSPWMPFTQADVEASVYHNSRLVSTGALDVMTTQRDVIYTAKAETRVKLHKKDKASLGLTVARLVEEGGPPTKVIFFGAVQRRSPL